MECYSSDMSNDYLVTDIVNELSSELEIPFLLSNDITLVDKQENVIYKNLLNEDYYEDICFSNPNNNELDDDYYLNSYSHKENFEINSSKDLLRKSNVSGSGSDCSSSEVWMTKNELDTPPITPPDERMSPGRHFLLPSEEFMFTSICPEDNQLLRGSNKIEINDNINVSGKVRIQPKPNSTALNFLDFHSNDSQKYVCNTFNNKISSTLKIKKHNIAVEPNNILHIGNSRRKTVLLKNDLELLQAKRKQERMIRNRESAYLSRKRKKEHVAFLEKQVQDLLAENNHLRLENCSLRQRLSKYEEINLLPNKKSQNIFMTSKKATAVFALMLTICLNFGPFSSFITDIKPKNSEIIKNDIIPPYSNKMRQIRSLLWTEPEFEVLNISYSNLTTTSCPIFINQSESIRLESELRRWIGGDKDFSQSFESNISKINQFFYSEDTSQSQSKNKASKQKYKYRTKSQEKDNLKNKLYQMKTKFFKFNTFFEAINRRDDTFYLVSFSGDHLLLPALSHNETSRPKMSLMFPAFLSNVTATMSDQVEMMQIDCEVTNTQLLSVNENDIPSHMRSFINSTSRSKAAVDQKSPKFDEFFINDVEKNLLNTKQRHLEQNNGNSKNQYSSDSYRIPVQLTKNNYLNSKNFKIDAQSNFNSSSISNIKTKKKFFQNLFDEKITDYFMNQTFKQNHPVDFATGNNKNLLKLLNIRSHGVNHKQLDLNSSYLEEKGVNRKFLLH